MGCPPLQRGAFLPSIRAFLMSAEMTVKGYNRVACGALVFPFLPIQLFFLDFLFLFCFAHERFLDCSHAT